MNLNHIDLQVPFVQEAASFFERWFAFEHMSNRGSPAIAILRGEGGFSLVLQRAKDGEKYPDGFHVGFLREDEASVLDFHTRAREAGLSISDVQRNNRGTLTYLRGPGGILIEVGCRPATTR